MDRITEKINLLLKYNDVFDSITYTKNRLSISISDNVVNYYIDNDEHCLIVLEFINVNIERIKLYKELKAKLSETYEVSFDESMMLNLNFYKELQHDTLNLNLDGSIYINEDLKTIDLCLIIELNGKTLYSTKQFSEIEGIRYCVETIIHEPINIERTYEIDQQDINIDDLELTINNIKDTLLKYDNLYRRTRC